MASPLALYLPAFFRNALFFILALLISCRHDPNELRLESRNFDQVIAREQNLVFTFDKDLVPASRWYNTRERAFARMTLGKMACRSQGTLQARVLQQNKQLGTFTGKDLTLVNTFSGGQLQLRTSNTGTLYYFWEAEGISRSGSYTAKDKHLQVRKAFLTDRAGPSPSTLSGKTT